MDSYKAFVDDFLKDVPDSLKEGADDLEEELLSREKPKKKKFEVFPEDFSRLDIRIGRIVRAIQNPYRTSKPSYLQNVEIGEDVTRLVISDLHLHYELDELEQRKIIVVCNVKKSQRRGLLHQAWILCANNGGKMELLTPPYACDEGDQVTVEGYPAIPELRDRRRIHKRLVRTVMKDLRVDSIGVATYRGIPLRVEGRHTISTPTLRDCAITDCLKWIRDDHIFS